MKTIRQLLRQPVKAFFGVVLIALLVAILTICVGQSVSAKKTEERLDDLFLTVALPTTNYNGMSRKLPEEISLFLDSLDTDYPDVIRAVSAPGLASAYIPQLKPDMYTNHTSYFGWETGTDGVISMMASSPVGVPYSCAMLEVRLEENLGKTPPIAWDLGTQDDWMLDAFIYYSINIRATVLGVIGLNEGFPELTDRTITLTLMLPDEQAFNALDLQMGERYLVYGMDYFDMGWLQSQNPDLWKSNTPTLTVRNKQQLKNLSEEYTVPMIAHLTGTAEDFLRSDEGKLWSQTLEGISVNNQAFPILGVDNLGYLAEFALGNTRLVQGRDFTEEELTQGSKVCILAESLAAANGVAVGDTITVQYYNYDENSPYQSMLSSGRGVVNPSAWFYTATTPFVNEGETYTVIGLYRSQNEWADPATNLYAFTPNTVFVPKASVSGTMDYCQQGLFRTYVLHNEEIEAFQELAAKAGYSDLFFCDDHGYAAVATSLHDYEEVAERALLIGLCLSALIAVLFLLLFPMQQQKTLNVMASMGATIQNRLGYIFRYSLSLLLPGCILGFVASILLWEQVTEKLTAQASIALAMEVDMPVLVLSAMTALFVILVGALLLALLRMNKKNLMNRK